MGKNPSERLIRRGKCFMRCHALEMRPSDLDCTDLSDDEFEALVCRTVGIFNFCTVPA